MVAQYLYNVYTQTILFRTILERVCDVGTTTTTMATARWAMAQQATTTMMIATSKDDDKDDGNGATGHEVVTGNSVTG